MNGGGPNSEFRMKTQDYKQLESHPLEKILTPNKYTIGISITSILYSSGLQKAEGIAVVY